MTEPQRDAARQSYLREAVDICPSCKGTGRVTSEGVKSRARKGGVHSYLRSLEAGQLSMTERGRRGGRPEEPSLAGLIDIDRGTRAREPKGVGT